MAEENLSGKEKKEAQKAIVSVYFRETWTPDTSFNPYSTSSKPSGAFLFLGHNADTHSLRSAFSKETSSVQTNDTIHESLPASLLEWSNALEKILKQIVAQKAHPVTIIYLAHWNQPFLTLSLQEQNEANASAE